MELKPNKLSFLIFWWYKIILWIILNIIWLIILYINPNAIILPIIFFILFIFFFIMWFIAYKKENYEFKNDKIIYSYWWIFSDNQIEIDYNKITQVIMYLPFIENKIFNTWMIIIKTAWSWTGKVLIRNINNYNEIYNEIQNKMHQNWIKLEAKNLVLESKPHFIWILWESTKSIFWNIIVLFYFIFWFLDEFWKNNNWNYFENKATLITWFIFISIIFIIIVIGFTLRYLDYKKRLYQVYDDSVFYNEWFLSKVYSFLPMEKVSDIENSQWFISKIFWIHDLIISSEWSNNKVSFLNMTNWIKMTETIKYLKEHISINTYNNSQNDTIIIEGQNQEEIIIQNNSTIKNIFYNKDFVWEYFPDMKKTLLLNLPLILIIYWIPVAIINLIKAKFTIFKIWQTSFEYKFDFIFTKQSSFSIDKITQVIITESILDKIFWTCSIAFSTIWSSETLTFSNIKIQNKLYENILSKIWIHKEETKKQIKTAFSLKDFYLSHIFFSTFFIIFSALMLFIPLILVVVYYKYYYSTKNYSHNIYQTYIESEYWLIIKTKKFAKLTDIKSIESIKYPLTSIWTLLLDISWDSKMQYWSKQYQYTIISNTIKIPFIKDVETIFDEVDEILNSRLINEDVIKTSKQDLWNTLIYAIPLSLLTIIFWPIIIWITIWYIKSKKYVLQKSRVLSFWGIIYKNKSSILFNKINFIEKNQWFINKLFWNWSISIFTKWSWFSDLKIENTGDFVEIYEQLKEVKKEN